MACGAGSLLSWGLAAGPLAFWAGSVRRAWKVLAAGAMVGIVAVEIGSATGQLWGTFHRFTFDVARAVLGLVDSDVIYDPENFELGIRGFSVSIAPVCSGFEGIGLIWAFLGAYLLLFRRDLRFPQALLLIPIGTVIIWLFNVLRIVVLVLCNQRMLPWSVRPRSPDASDLRRDLHAEPRHRKSRPLNRALLLTSGGFLQGIATVSGTSQPLAGASGRASESGLAPVDFFSEHDDQRSGSLSVPRSPQRQVSDDRDSSFGLCQR